MAIPASRRQWGRLVINTPLASFGRAVFNRSAAVPRFFLKNKTHIRVATFNVHFGKDVAGLARALRENRNLAQADVVLLQEIEYHKKEGSSRASRLAGFLDMEYVYVPARKLALGRGSHGLAVLSRLPILDLQIVRLPKFRPLSSRPRLAVSFAIRFQGKKIKIYNVHLNGPLSFGKRLSQLEGVISMIAKEKPGQPVIMAGDFNTIPMTIIPGTIFPVFYDDQKNKFHKLLKDLGFATNCRLAGHTMKSGPVRFQLDGIYPKNAKVVKFAVERGVKVSDHFPLWADIKI